MSIVTFIRLYVKLMHFDKHPIKIKSSKQSAPCACINIVQCAMYNVHSNVFALYIVRFVPCALYIPMQCIENCTMCIVYLSVSSMALLLQTESAKVNEEMHICIF